MDGIDDLCRVQDDIAVPKAQHPKACGPQEAIASLVVFPSLGVLASVELDNQPGFDAGEIADVQTNLMLPPEFVAVELTSSQPRPKDTLGIGHVCTEEADVSAHPRMKAVEVGENVTGLLLMRVF